MRQRSWYVHSAPVAKTVRTVLDANPGDLWGDMLREKGGGFERVATWPSDPSLN